METIYHAYTYLSRLYIILNAVFRLQAIFHQLSQLGLRYRKEFILYSDYFLPVFKEKFSKKLGWTPSESLYNYAVSFTLNSCKNVQTTILGTWLFLEIMKKTSDIGGAIAEVGAFEGGNALCALNFASARELRHRDYYIFDSFEGFPDLSEYDPAHNVKKGDLCPAKSFYEICDDFAIFPQAFLIKGFVPDTFIRVPDSSVFSLVFYDADLYQPARDTFEFFWERIMAGGYLLVHDFETEPGGFIGVKKAVEEFFDGKGVSVMSFTENTMAVIKKPLDGE